MEPVTIFLTVKLAGSAIGKMLAAKAAADGVAAATIAPHMGIGGAVAHAQMAATLGVTHSVAHGPGALLGTLAPAAPLRALLLDAGKEYGPKIIEANMDPWERRSLLADQFYQQRREWYDPRLRQFAGQVDQPLPMWQRYASWIGDRTALARRVGGEPVLLTSIPLMGA